MAESRASALRMSRLAVRSQLLQACAFAIRRLLTEMLKTSCSWQVLHAATLGCDVSLMEPALKEAEEREAEIEAAHRQAQTDVKRARGGLAAAERKLEMGQQAEMQNVQTLDEEEKVRGEAVAKLQAQIRGHSARNAMHELSIPSPSEAARRCTSRDGIKHSVSTRIQTTPSGCDEDGESGLPNAQTRGPSSAVPAVGQAQSFGVRLPAGCDGGVLEEVSMRSAAKGALLRVESILCLSKIRTMSMEMAEHTSAQMTLEAKVRSGLRTTMERLRTAFPQLAWHASSGTELSAESLREASASVLRLTAVVPGAADYSQGQPLGLSFKEPAHPADDQEDYGSVGSRISEENPAAADETVPLQPSASKTIRQELFVCECLHAMAALADFVERAAVMHAEAEQVAAARAKAAEATRAEAVDSMALPTAATSTSAAEADAAEGASDPAAAHEPKRVALPPRRTPGTEASRDADAVTTPKQVELADAAVQVGRDEHDRPAPSMVQAPKPAHIEPRQLQSPAVVSADAGCSPHASPREILRMMLQESGLLDTADPCRAHEHEPSGPEGAMAKLVRTFQWDDRVRQSTDAEPRLSQGTHSAARPSSAPPSRMSASTSRTSAPALELKDMELWQEQMDILKQQMQAEALRVTDAERRAMQLDVQLRAARQQAMEAEEFFIGSNSSNSTATDDVKQLRRLLSLVTPGLHGQSLPWSPRLSASGSAAVLRARAALPIEKAGDKERQCAGSPAEKGDKDVPAVPGAERQNVFRRLHRHNRDSGSARWSQRRADLQQESARSTEAVMQAFSSIRHTGAVFAEMRSRFDAPHDGPEPAGVVDKLLARLRLGDLALPPLRRGGEASVSGSWTSPGAANSWQLGRPMEHSARAQSSQPTTWPK